jgi:hypothetical protein
MSNPAGRCPSLIETDQPQLGSRSNACFCASDGPSIARNRSVQPVAS